MNNRAGRNLLCLLVIAFGAALTASAQATVFPAGGSDQTFRIGGQSFSFPTPSADLSETGPDYRVLFETLAPTTNRLVAAFIPPSDVNRARDDGAPSSLEEYALIEVPRRAEFSSVDVDGFKQVTDAVAKQFAGDLAGTVQEQQAEINQRLKAMGSSTSVTVQKPVLLGAFFAKPDACGYGMIVPYTANDKTVQMAMSLTVIRAHNHVIFAYLYTPYKDDSTLSWLRITTEEWSDAIQNANR